MDLHVWEQNELLYYDYFDKMRNILIILVCNYNPKIYIFIIICLSLVIISK